VGLAPGWNTWDPDRPAAFVHRPSGLQVRIGVFSTRASSYTDVPFSVSVVRLGPHAPDGGYAEAEVGHVGSRVRVRFAGDGPRMAGGVTVEDLGEWALRFWIVVAVGGIDGRPMRLVVPEGERAYVDPPLALGACSFTTSPRPVNAFVYDDLDDVRRDFEEHGYYARPAARDEGVWAVFRFNAVTPAIAFVASADAGVRADDVRAAADVAGQTLDRRAAALAGEPARRAAVRDVLGWNTVWDPVNDRPYTVATRGWVSARFGGFLVWQVDTFLHALMAAQLGDAELAVANLRAALSLATPYGNLRALESPVTSWVHRAHPPVGALATWWVHRCVGLSAELLDHAVSTLATAFAWWFEHRDGNGDGLLEYGSSPVGDGHFVHTKLAAMDESAMDNSPVHDEATFRIETHTLDVADVGLNALLVLEGSTLARLLDELGRTEEARELRALADALAGRVREELWDDERGIFANRRWDGAFVRSVSPTSVFPLLAGIATPEQVERTVRDHLLDPNRFWGEHPVASTPHDDPAAVDNVYWRGRVWPPLNLLTYLALRRYGYRDEARALAERGAATFERAWADRRSYENVDQRTGEGGGTADADPFYTWGALLPLIADLDAERRTPWDDLLATSGSVTP
jgi:putative isomerase